MSSAERTTWDIRASSDFGPHFLALSLLLALGAPPEEITALLPGLLPQQLGLLSVNKIITERVSELRKRYLGANADEQFQNHMPKAFEIMTKVLSDKSGDLKLTQQFEAAKWLMEKVTGKARQELELQAGVTLLSFMKTLDGMRTERETVPLDMTKKLSEPTKQDPIDAWVSAHIEKETQ